MNFHVRWPDWHVNPEKLIYIVVVVVQQILSILKLQLHRKLGKDIGIYTYFGSYRSVLLKYLGSTG